MAGKRVTIPIGHRPAMRVPEGGACCANCKFHNPVGKSFEGFGTCEEPNFRAYYGTKVLPYPADQYCSDWYESAKRLPP